MVKDQSYSEREETRCRHIGYSFRLAARVLLYASSHRQDNTYHGLCYTSCGALAGMRNSSMGPPNEGSIRQPIAPWANALITELHLAPRDRTTSTSHFYHPFLNSNFYMAPVRFSGCVCDPCTTARCTPSLYPPREWNVHDTTISYCQSYKQVGTKRL